MTIRFTIAKRGLLSKEMEGTRTDESQQAQENEATTLKDAASQHLSDKLWLRSLRPRLEHRPTVDAVEFHFAVRLAEDILLRLVGSFLGKGNRCEADGLSIGFVVQDSLYDAVLGHRGGADDERTNQTNYSN